MARKSIKFEDRILAAAFAPKSGPNRFVPLGKAASKKFKKALIMPTDKEANEVIKLLEKSNDLYRKAAQIMDTW
jgi:hypothetical protein